MAAFFALLLLAVVSAPAQEKAKVVEEIIARVNNEIVTASDLVRARASLSQEVNEDCQQRGGCNAEERAAMLKDREQNVLRDLIDQSLLVQRAKDAGVNVESELIRRMDQIRQQNNIPSMEALESAVTASGINFEDWKAQMRNGMLTQALIQREVGGNLKISDDEVKKYYDEHKDTFVRPEKVYLSEIFVNTEGKTPEELPTLEQRAKNLYNRVKNGEDFFELAKRFSDGSTAKEGGSLGDEGFARGELSKEISEAVFKMNRGDITEVMRTQTGFLILRVDQRYEAGLQPVEKVSNEIQNRLYYEKMRPALREYLTKLREESYVLVKPGYHDSSAVAVTVPIEEVQPPAEKKDDEKKKKKRFIIF
jgi:peptidyl-prolyl cis-trans isomerase SurA